MFGKWQYVHKRGIFSSGKAIFRRQGRRRSLPKLRQGCRSQSKLFRNHLTYFKENQRSMTEKDPHSRMLSSGRPRCGMDAAQSKRTPEHRTPHTPSEHEIFRAYCPFFKHALIPRKCLDWVTPDEAFYNFSLHLTIKEANCHL